MGVMPSCWQPMRVLKATRLITRIRRLFNITLRNRGYNGRNNEITLAASMIKQIYVPYQLGHEHAIEVVSVAVKEGARIRQGDVLLTLRQDGVLVPIRAEAHGWVRQVCVAPSQAVSVGNVMLVVDVVDSVDYCVDPSEFSVDTELGRDGRRGLERAGNTFGDFARELFDAPSTQEQGMGKQSIVEAHPMMQNFPEGMPPKESGKASDNQMAQDDIERAENANELKLGQTLENRLALTQTLSSSPTPSPL